MKPKALVSALVAISLAIGGPAAVFGQADNQQNLDRNFRRAQRDSAQKSQGGYRQRDQRANQRHGQQGQRPPAQRGYQQQGPSGGYAQRGDGRPDERGAGPDHQYHRGDRLPAEYRHRNYVVDDWRGHGLSAPPRGYQWVQSGSDYLLIAIATGIIAQLLLSN